MTHRLSLLSVICALVFVASLGACGDGSGSAGDGGGQPKATSGVAASKGIGALTDADKQAICDWTAALYGGYGGEVVCDDGSGFTLTITGPADRAECLAEAATIPASCKATVGQAETCTRALSTCDESDDAAAASACTAMMTCSN